MVVELTTVRVVVERVALFSRQQQTCQLLHIALQLDLVEQEEQVLKDQTVKIVFLMEQPLLAAVVVVVLTLLEMDYLVDLVAEDRMLMDLELLAR